MNGTQREMPSDDQALPPADLVEIECALLQGRAVRDPRLAAAAVKAAQARKSRTLKWEFFVLVPLFTGLGVAIGFVLFEEPLHIALMIVGIPIVGTVMGWWIPEWRPVSRSESANKALLQGRLEPEGPPLLPGLWIVAGTVALIATWIPDLIARLLGTSAPLWLSAVTWLIAFFAAKTLLERWWTS